MSSLAGKTAIVTGGSRGIGLAIVQGFIREGATVLVASRTPPPCDNPELHWLATDIAVTKDVDALFDTANELFNGKLDILVNNAGVQVAKTIDCTTDEEWDWLNGVNLRGSFQCCRQAVRWMRESGGGAIVNLGSISAQTADYELAIYSASKAWLQGLTRAIAADHGRHGIRCNAVCPTWTATEMSTEFFALEDDPAKAEAGVARRHPLGRMATPEDIAQACIWLASDQAGFVSGQCLTVDGGMSAASPVNPRYDFK